MMSIITHVCGRLAGRLGLTVTAPWRTEQEYVNGKQNLSHAIYDVGSNVDQSLKESVFWLRVLTLNFNVWPTSLSLPPERKAN